MFKQFKSGVLAILAFAFGLLAVPAAMAQAALPTGVAAAVTEAGEVMVLGATAVIVAMVAFWGLRKLGSKLGWW